MEHSPMIRHSERSLDHTWTLQEVGYAFFFLTTKIEISQYYAITDRLTPQTMELKLELHLNEMQHKLKILDFQIQFYVLPHVENRSNRTFKPLIRLIRARNLNDYCNECSCC